MHRAKYEYLRKRAIRKQPADDQMLLDTYETFEQQLINLAQSEEELLYLMHTEKPFLMTAKALNLTESDVYERIQRLEKVMSSIIDQAATHLKLIDVSDSLPLQTSPLIGDVKTFLLTMQTAQPNKTKKNQKGG